MTVNLVTKLAELEKLADVVKRHEFNINAEDGLLMEKAPEAVDALRESVALVRLLIRALTRSANLIENVGAGYGWQLQMALNRATISSAAQHGFEV